MTIKTGASAMVVRGALLALIMLLGGDALAQLNYPDMMYYKFNTSSSRASQTNDAFPREGSSSASYGQYTSSYYMRSTTGAVRDANNNTTRGVYGYNWYYRYGYYCNTGYNYDIQPNESVTIEFWARSWNDYCCYYRNYAYGTNSYSYMSAYNYRDRVYFRFGGYEVDSNVNNYRQPYSSTWTHYAMVYDGGDREIRTYIDGNLTNTRTNVSINQSSQRVYLYNHDSNTYTPREHFYGYMDELRFWRRERTAAELAANKDQELTKPSGFFVGAKPLSGERVQPSNNQVVWRGTLGSPSTSSSLSSITWTKQGSLPDNMITSVKLYNDNGNGQPSGGALATGSMSNGQAQLNYSTSFSTDQLRDVVLTYDISTSAPGGATFGATVTSESDVNLSSGTALSFSDASGPLFSIWGKAGSLPWASNFDSLPTNARWYNRGTPTYPYTSSTTSTPNVSYYYSPSGANFPTNNQIGGTYRNRDPISQPNMAIMEFGSGPNHDALDFAFDLSGYTLASDQVVLTYNWLENTSNYNDDYYGVFISVNGGSSWLRKMAKLDPNSPQEWSEEELDLQAILQAAGQSSYTDNIVIRFQGMGNSDGHYMLFDDFSLVVREPSLMLERPDLPVSTFPAAPGASDVVVHAAKVTAVVDAQTITDITVTKTGNIDDSEISAVKLFADGNGNGYLDAADTQLGMSATFTSGEADFTATPALAAMGADETATVFVTYTLDAMATPGATFGASLAADSDITISSGDPITAAGDFPFAGPTLQVASGEGLPFSTDFESGLPGNISGTTAAGAYPSASGAGQTLGESFSAKPGRIQLASGAVEGLSANSGRNMMVVDYPGSGGQGAGAIEFAFDLSNYDAMSDAVIFSFNVADFSGGEENGDIDGVYVSDDAGATWTAKAWHPDWSQINGWTRVDINLSDVMNTAMASFTGDMLVRVQGADDLEAPWDGFAIDDVFCGLSPVASVSRSGTDIADGGMDDVGNLTLDAATTISYDVANLGDQPLDLGDAFASANATNIDTMTGISFSGNDEGDSFDVTFQPAAAGAFSFDIMVPFPNDPSLMNGVYTITIEGEGGIAPTITSTAPAIATVGRPFSYQVTADASPAPTFSVLNAPAWLTLTGDTLSGTPTSGDVGQTAPITVTASNGVGTDASQDFQITVSQEVEPTITSTPIEMATVGQVYQYLLSADGAPEPTYTVTGLPGWLSFDGSRTITGTAAAQPGMPVPTYTTGTITITATNGIGIDDVQTYEITVVDPSVAASAQITSVPSTSVEVGVAYSYTVGVVGNPDPTVTVTGLPAWASFDSTTNVISGTPMSADAGTTAEIVITAENGVGQDAVQSYTLTVIDSGVEARITSVPGTFVQFGDEYAYQITVAGTPVPTVTVSGLPDWLSFDSATGTISGMPMLAEDLGVSSAITVTASNGIGTDAVQAFQVVVLPKPETAAEESDCSLSSGSGSNGVLWLALAALAACALAITRRRTV